MEADHPAAELRFHTEKALEGVQRVEEGGRSRVLIRTKEPRKKQASEDTPKHFLPRSLYSLETPLVGPWDWIGIFSHD